MTIKIEKSDASELISVRSLSTYQVAVLISIVHYSTSGTAKYIYLDKLHFIFDLVLCKRGVDDLPKLTIPSWKIDKELKNKIIILVTNEILIQDSDSNKKVRFRLSDKGQSIYDGIYQIEDLSKTIKFIENICSSISTAVFSKSRVLL